ncbi:MAG: FkbM family methyltransferase [Verrucomicrobiota bacterium]
MSKSVPHISEPGFNARFGRWLGTRFRGVKGVDRILRTLHDPDRRQSNFFRTVASAYPEGPKYHLESKWFTEWTTWFYGSQDRPIHRWIVKNARPDWVTFDIGMNFGYFTCLLASICTEVHGFEPVGWLAGRARANVQLNAFANVTINELALSDHAGTAQLNLPAPDHCNWGTSSLVHKSSSQTAVVEVPLETLDNYCAAHGVTRLDFIKVDVEGAEHLVFGGAERTLERLRPTIIFEFNEESGTESYRLLEKLDYGLFDLDRRPMDVAKARLHDVLAIPNF